MPYKTEEDIYEGVFINDRLNLTLLTRAGMFIEFVANPMPYVIAASTPKKLATSFSSSSCLSRFPV